MRSILFSASSLLFLLGCPTAVIVDPPAVTPAVKLASGSYGVVVTDVVALECGEARAEDLFGMQLSMELTLARGGHAEAVLAGTYLVGAMSGGVLELDSEERDDRSKEVPGEDSQYPDSPDCAEETEVDEADEDVEDVEDPDVEGGGGGGGRRGCGGGKRPDSNHRFSTTSLEIVASRTDHGQGFLAYSDGLCRLEVAVEVQALDSGDGTVPVDTTEPASEPDCEDDVDSPDGGAPDCG